jgi:6-bladed beta-propeller protein
MKLLNLLILIMITLLLYSCSSGQNNPSSHKIDYHSIKIIKKNATRLNDIGKITKAIKLETTEDSILSYVSQVYIDPGTGDLLVGDFQKGNRLMRYNNEGKFIRRYGRIGQGPGEYKYIEDFCNIPNGDIIMLTREKLIKFASDGKLLKEIRPGIWAHDIEILNDLIYIHTLDSSRDKKNRGAISVFDFSLQKKDSFGPFDRRYEKARLGLVNYLAKFGNNLYFLENYDPAINIYNTNTKEIKRFQVPNDNGRLDVILGKKQLTQKDHEEIMNVVHHFISIISVGDKLLLSESCREKEISSFWLMDFEKKQAVIFPGTSLFGDYKKKVQDDLFFDLYSGYNGNGIIGVFRYPEKFNLHKKNQPFLKDIPFNNDDNPILVFFEFL